MLIGYARVSTDDQETAIQESALKQAGCGKIFPEIASGGRWDRPQLARALDHLRAGDVLVVWKLDRLSRSLKDLLTIMERIDQLGAGFCSLTEAIDTTMVQPLGHFLRRRRQIRRRGCLLLFCHSQAAGSAMPAEPGPSAQAPRKASVARPTGSAG